MKFTAGIIVGVTVLVGAAYFITSSGDVSTESTQQESQQLAVTTSFYPLQFALERIAGDNAVVTNIGSGIDPHDFKPSVQDMVTLQQSDLVVLQGADFEPWGDDVMVQLEAAGIPVVVATAGIALHEAGHDHAADHHTDKNIMKEDGHADEYHDEEYQHDEEHHEAHEHGTYDPHTWLDPVLFSQMVAHLVEGMVAVDSKNAAFYEENARVLQTELEGIDVQYAQALSSCTLDEVITSHDAFGYLADRYGFSVHAIAGLSTQDTPSVTTLAELREEAAEGIGAILLEENSVTAYGETLARETGLQTLSLNPIAHSIPEGKNYVTLMQENLVSFSAALECNE